MFEGLCPIRPSHVAESAERLGKGSSLRFNPAVQENERKIWREVEDEICCAIQALGEIRNNSRAPVNVVEVGGSSLCGLEMIRRNPQLQRCNYIIVDEEPINEPTKLSQLNGRFYHGTARDLPLSFVGGPIDLVLGVRALEYDCRYGETLAHLRSLCAQRSYGIFVHNAENSTVFTSLDRYSLGLEVREIANSILVRMATGVLARAEGCELMRSHWESLPPEMAVREQSVFRRSLTKIETALEKDTVDSLLESLESRAHAYRCEIGEISSMYAERRLSRRFWEEEDPAAIKQEYLPYGPLVLQRVLFSTGGTYPLRVNIDTVDMFNAWESRQDLCTAGVVPEVCVDKREGKA